MHLETTSLEGTKSLQGPEGLDKAGKERWIFCYVYGLKEKFRFIVHSKCTPAVRWAAFTVLLCCSVGEESQTSLVQPDAGL